MWFGGDTRFCPTLSSGVGFHQVWPFLVELGCRCCLENQGSGLVPRPLGSRAHPSLQLTGCCPGVRWFWGQVLLALPPHRSEGLRHQKSRLEHQEQVLPERICLSRSCFPIPWGSWRLNLAHMGQDTCDSDMCVPLREPLPHASPATRVPSRPWGCACRLPFQTNFGKKASISPLGY